MECGDLSPHSLESGDESPHSKISPNWAERWPRPAVARSANGLRQTLRLYRKPSANAATAEPFTGFPI